MTENERHLVVSFGTFCHVASQANVEQINQHGLSPERDQSVVLRGPEKAKAVYLCPEASLVKTLAFVGANHSYEPHLYVYRIPATELCEKKCGPDYGFLVNVMKLEEITLETSLARGTVACYEAIEADELTGPEQVPNPEFMEEGGLQ